MADERENCGVENPTYERLLILIQNESPKRPPTPEEITEISNFLCSTTCVHAHMEIWGSLHKNTRWLFPIHSQIEKNLVAAE